MATPYKIDDDFILKFGDWIRKRAKKIKDNAGYNGDHHDGGASRLNAEWDCYVAGYTHSEFPVTSHGNIKHMEEFLQKQDPDYPEYIRLKAKFEK